MANSSEKWRELIHDKIAPGYLISSQGRIAIKSGIYIHPAMDPSYHSSNGYDYHPFLTTKNGIPTRPVLYPIDELVALTFVEFPKSLIGKPIKVTHINGNTRDNNFENLKWEEDIEEWVEPICPITMKNGKVINPKKGLYKISSFGQLYSNYLNDYMIMQRGNPCHRDDYYKCMLVCEDDCGHIYRKHVKLHRLLAFSFRLPGYDKDLCVNHINGITADNHLKNLEFVTNQQNVRHAFDVMLEINPSGEEHPRAKFTDHQRKCIYEIIKTLDDIQPSHLTGLIRRRLPAISRDDVKYAKKLIRRSGHEFPDLSDKWKNPQKFSEEEWLELETRVDAIFDKYCIYQMEVYENEHRKTV